VVRRAATTGVSEAVVRQPATVTRDVGLDLAGSLPRAGVSRLRGDAVRTTIAVTSRSITSCPGLWFTSFGVVWHQRGSGAVTGTATWLGEHGAVLGHQALAPDDDGGDAVGGPSGPSSTPLVWTGGGRCVRLVLRLPAGVTVADPHVAFANTSGSAAGPGTGPPDVAVSPGVDTTDLAAPDGAPGASPEGRAANGGGPPMPAMVSRAAWGAQPSTFNTGSPGCSAPYYSPIKVAYVHHTSGSNSYSRAQSDDIMRGIDWYHTQERGYCDIAYDFLVDRFGTIFVGRAGGIDLPVVPGSQAGFNPFTFSVSVMGNFATAAPPHAAILGVERVLAWKLDLAHVPAEGTATLVSQGYDTDRYPPGQRITMHTIEGHRRTSQTDCPGRIWNLLPQIRRAVAAMGGPKIYRPAESAPQITPGHGSVQFTATASAPLRWSVTIERQDGTGIRPLQQPGSSTSLHVAWDGRNANGIPAPPGTYEAVVDGATAGSASPRQATLQIDVPGPPSGPLPVPSGTVQVHGGFAMLRAVAATGPSDVWAVGTVATNGAIRPLIRHLGQSRWTTLGGPNPGVHGSGLQAVAATGPDDVWAGGFSCLSSACGPNGGFGSRTLMEHWDGHAWTVVPTPSPGTALNEIRAVDAVAPDNVWAAGLWSDQGRWLRHGLVLHWDGASWRQVRIPFVPGEAHLDGISASGPGDAWAAGEVCPGPCSGLAHSAGLLLHWNGAKFTRVQPAPLGADRSGMNAVVDVSPTEAWAVGGRSANRVAPTHPLIERWDGTRWRPVAAPLEGKSSELYDVLPGPGGRLWSVGTFGTNSAERPFTLRRNASGAWQRVGAPSPNVRLAFLSGAATGPTTDMWAVGPATSGPFALHWNGHAWSIASTG
jgi:N-acetylmuramoyl-L-alanine amidase-like protein